MSYFSSLMCYSDEILFNFCRSMLWIANFWTILCINQFSVLLIYHITNPKRKCWRKELLQTKFVYKDLFWIYTQTQKCTKVRNLWLCDILIKIFRNNNRETFKYKTKKLRSEKGNSLLVASTKVAELKPLLAII